MFNIICGLCSSMIPFYPLDDEVFWPLDSLHLDLVLMLMLVSSVIWNLYSVPLKESLPFKKNYHGISYS